MAEANASNDSVPDAGKTTGKDLEVSHVETFKSVDEKQGLPAYAEDGAHRYEPKMSLRRFLALSAMAFLWVGSQIPLYLFGGCATIIYGDLGGADRWTWFVLGNLLALAAICPFVGSLSDLLGRRYVALMGAVFLMIGMIVCGTAANMNNFIGGMSLAGVGAGINELTALAVTSELAPVAKRGKYVAVLIFTILPFCGSIMYGQLIAVYANWRWIALFCALWQLIGFVLTLAFYFPPPRPNSDGMSRRQVLRRIDYIGGSLSIFGMILFMAGLQWGNLYPWASVHVLVPLFLGAALLAGFLVWESLFAEYPMFPSRLKQAPRILILTLVITAISGANFFSILLFFPTQAYNMYNHDPVQIGLKGLCLGLSILTGAVVVLWMLSVLRGHNRELLVASSVLMTVGCGAMSLLTPDKEYAIWPILIVGCLGIGGIVVPASIITTIICPADLIATIAALTLAIRVIGGSVAYAIYYNVFVQRFTLEATALLAPAIASTGITSVANITAIIELTGAGLLEDIRAFPPLATNETAYNIVVDAGKWAFSNAYAYVYYVSIPFGFISIVCACFLGDISDFMDDSVAVVME